MSGVTVVERERRRVQRQPASLMIRDTGVGIPRAQRSCILQHFTQDGSDDHAEALSTGWVRSELVRIMGGRIAAASR